MLSGIINQLSRRMGKPTICIFGENKGADKHRTNCEADQRLCVRYKDSTILLLSKSKICNLLPTSVPLQPGLCWTFSHAQARFECVNLTFFFICYYCRWCVAALKSLPVHRPKCRFYFSFEPLGSVNIFGVCQIYCTLKSNSHAPKIHTCKYTPVCKFYSG